MEDESKLIELIEAVLVAEQITTAGNNYLWKEQLMQLIQRGVIASRDAISNQDDFNRVIEEEINKAKADMDLSYEMIEQTLKQIPQEIFFKAAADVEGLPDDGGGIVE